MPTNLWRAKSKPDLRAQAAAAQGAPRMALLVAGAISIRLQLLDTATASVIWRALPIYSTAETWGECVHFELPLEAGRDRTAVINGCKQDVYFWADDDRVVVPFGPTPISGPNEIRLMRPCNRWAVALDDVSLLIDVWPGQKIGLLPEQASPQTR